MSIENHGGISSTGWDPWHGRGRRMGRATARLANAMMEELDADDDGSLSATESQLSEPAFAALDKNGDGAVSNRELRAGLRSKRDELIDLMRSGTDAETGSDGTTDPAVTTGPTAEQAAAVAGLLIEKGDTDGDGALSATETGLAGDVFASLDTDGDGLLSAGELSGAALAGTIAATLDGKLAVRLTTPAAQQGADTTDTTDPTGGGTDTTAITAAGAATTDTASATVGAMASRIAQRIVDHLDADDSGGLSQPESGLDQNRFALIDTDGDGSVTANEFGGSLQQMLDVMGALHALSSVARNNYGRRAYGMAARDAVDRYEGNMGGLMTALFETAPTGSTGATTEGTGAVAATGGSASGDAGTATADSSPVGDIAAALADAAAAEAAQAAKGAAESAA